MIRPATRADLPRLFEIRDNAGADPLSDPSAVTAALALRLIDLGTLWVWQDTDGSVSGFAAADASDGSIPVLLVAVGHEGKGIGRALLKTACGALRDAGQGTATLAIGPNAGAERHYRAAGWTATGENAGGGLIFQKPL